MGWFWEFDVGGQHLFLGTSGLTGLSHERQWKIGSRRCRLNALIARLPSCQHIIAAHDSERVASCLYCGTSLHLCSVLGALLLER